MVDEEYDCRALVKKVKVVPVHAMKAYRGSTGIAPPIPMAARSKAWVCGRSLAGIVGSNPEGGMDVCLL
jgi:hypothetical protein